MLDKQAPNTPAAKKRRSLIADDEIENTGLLQEILRGDRAQYGRGVGTKLESSPQEEQTTESLLLGPQPSTDADELTAKSTPQAPPTPQVAQQKTARDTPHSITGLAPLREGNRSSSDTEASLGNADENVVKTTSSNVVKTTSSKNSLAPRLPGNKGKKRIIHTVVRPKRPMTEEQAVREIFAAMDSKTDVFSVRGPIELHDLIVQYIGENFRDKITKLDVFARGLALVLIEAKTGKPFVDFDAWQKIITGEEVAENMTQGDSEGESR